MSRARQMHGRTAAQPTPSRVERARDPQDTQRRLLEAGLDVFGHKGYAAASVNEIVRQAGCSKGAFYCHFASKEDFFFTILERRLQGNMARFQEQCPWKGNCAQWLLDTLQTMAGFTETDPTWRALSIEFMAHGIRDRRVGQRIAHMHQRFRQFLADTLRHSEAFLNQRMAADPEVIAATVTALLDGVIMHSSIEPKTLPAAEFIQHIQPLLAAWFAAS
jgi:AcrR family transcriptional regulator